MARTLITGGTLVTATDTIDADLLVDGERILAVGRVEQPVDHVIDATGCLVMPGGVDTHTHFAHLSANGSTRTADDFRTGSIAAVVGGTTTYVDFVRPAPGETVWDGYQRRKDEASKDSVVDFAFHPIVPQHAAEDGSFDQLVRLAREEGATSWKFFMAYPGSMVDDGTLLAGMRLCRDNGVLPMVHAENGHMIADAVERQVAAGRVAEHFHAGSHPVGAEREAIQRAAAIAEWVGSPLFVVHVSSAGGADEILRARDRGLRVLGETCPQYLLASYEDYAGLGFEAAAYVCSPPIREAANQDALWRALALGAIGTVGTDHAAFAMTELDGLPPQKPRGRGYFPQIPNGVPGVEERLLLLWHHGVGTGRLSPNEFVDRVSTRPARVFGLHPRKGSLAPGADADLLIWDPRRELTISSERVRTRAGYSLYDGMTVTGAPRTVLSRGQVVVDDGVLSAAPGRGRHLHRAAVVVAAL